MRPISDNTFVIMFNINEIVAPHLGQFPHLLASFQSAANTDPSLRPAWAIGGVKRDLNPRFNKTHYTISNDDKDYLETVAIRLLLETEPETLNLWYAYKNKKNETSRMFDSLDRVCVMWKCIEFVKSGQFKFADFQAYWDYWTPDKARQSLHPAVAEIYMSECWSLIQSLNIR